jgi:hypothetical protein
MPVPFAEYPADQDPDIARPCERAHWPVDSQPHSSSVDPFFSENRTCLCKFVHLHCAQSREDAAKVVIHVVNIARRSRMLQRWRGNLCKTSDGNCSRSGNSRIVHAKRD